MRSRHLPTLFLNVRLTEVPPTRATLHRNIVRHELVVEYRSDSVSLSGVVSGECLGVIRTLLERDLRALAATGCGATGRDPLLVAATLDPVA
jgi:hypothetical protein